MLFLFFCVRRTLVKCCIPLSSFLKIAWEELNGVVLPLFICWRSGIFVLHRAPLLYSASPPYNVQKRWQAAFDNVNLATFNVKRELVVVRCGQRVVI